MDRSKVDGSRVTHEDTSRLGRVRKLSTFLCLVSPKKVQLALHNAYRDVHFMKLSDGADFEKEARAAEIRARPQHKVEHLHPSRRLDAREDAAARKYIKQFTWVPDDKIWEEFEAPILDMGVAVVGGKERCFRVMLQNTKFSLAKVRLCAEDCGPLRLPWRDVMLGPGQTAEVIVNVAPVECGEWCGRILVNVAWPSESCEDNIAVPTYSRVAHAHGEGADLARSLPHFAPRPFRPGSSRRTCLDPASISSHQMRTPTPGCSRPGSAVSAGPGGALNPQRLGYQVAQARPPLAPLAPVAACLRALEARARRPGGDAEGGSARAASARLSSVVACSAGAGYRLPRPHSAPMPPPCRPTSADRSVGTPAAVGTTLLALGASSAATRGANRSRPLSAGAAPTRKLTS